MSGRKRLLFVCVENAGRSQMVEAFFRRYAPVGFSTVSAGTTPGSAVNPAVAAAMKEVRIDVGGNIPKPLTAEMIDGAVVVNMERLDSSACPAPFVDDARLADTRSQRKSSG